RARTGGLTGGPFRDTREPTGGAKARGGRVDEKPPLASAKWPRGPWPRARVTQQRLGFLAFRCCDVAQSSRPLFQRDRGKRCAAKRRSSSLGGRTGYPHGQAYPQ